MAKCICDHQKTICFRLPEDIADEAIGSKLGIGVKINAYKNIILPHDNYHV